MQGLQLVAISNYHADTDDELGLRKGEYYQLLDGSDEYWSLVCSVKEPDVVGYAPKECLIEAHTKHNLHVHIDGTESMAASDQSPLISPEHSIYQQAAMIQHERQEQAPTTVLRRLTHIVMKKPEELDPMHSYGNIPEYYKASILAEFTHEGQGSLSKTMIPQSDISNLSFRDLHFDHPNKTIRRIRTPFLIPFSVIEAKHLPAVPEDFKVIGYQLRMALYDKVNLLSNVHQVPAYLNPKTGVWKFTQKSSTIFAKNEDNTCFLRTNLMDVNLTILFELTVQLESKDPRQTELLELCCGWGMLPLFTAEGQIQAKKTYRVKLYRGNALDKAIDYFPDSPKKGGIRGLLQSRIPPYLDIETYQLNREQVSELCCLPQTVLGGLAESSILVHFRKLYANAIYSDLWDGRWNSINEPSLAILPHLMDEPSLFRYVARLWKSRYSSFKTKEKRSIFRIRETMNEVLFSIYPYFYIYPLTPFSNSKEKEILLKNILENHKSHGTTEFMNRFHRDLAVEPFNIQEFCLTT